MPHWRKQLNMTNEQKRYEPEKVDVMSQPDSSPYESFTLPSEQPKEEHLFADKPFPKKTREELGSVPEYIVVIDVLKTCNDPELGLDVWTLGLIYDIATKNDAVHITMTLTSPLCPYGPMIIDEMETKLNELSKEVTIDVVFSPLWQPDEELREMLGM